MGMDSMNALAALQALAAKSGTTADTKKATEEQNSFNEVLAKMQKEQDDWDALMDQVDIAQYKLALTDSFWSSQADPKKHISNYLERHQGKIGTESLEFLGSLYIFPTCLKNCISFGSLFFSLPRFFPNIKLPFTCTLYISCCM